jgi:hypothetical protein
MSMHVSFNFPGLSSLQKAAPTCRLPRALPSCSLSHAAACPARHLLRQLHPPPPPLQVRVRGAGLPSWSSLRV